MKAIAFFSVFILIFLIYCALQGCEKNAVGPKINVKKIVFHSGINHDGELYVINASGGGRLKLTNNSNRNYYPSFSPDGSKIVFVNFVRFRDGNSEIYIMNTDGSNQPNLTNSPNDDAVPIFSPDGSKIAFNSTSDDNRDIYIMNTDGSGQTRLTNSPNDDALPAFSPTAPARSVFGFSTHRLRLGLCAVFPR